MEHKSKPNLLVILSESILAKSIALREAKKSGNRATEYSILEALRHEQESYAELAEKLGWWTN